MAKKTRNQPNSIILDRFSDADLRTWNRLSELSAEYNIKLFYHLESLRVIHHQELCDSLQSTKMLKISEKEWWRFVDHKYTNQPLSAKGSVIKGGRFNIGNDIGVAGFKPFPVLYIAENEETAKAEKFGATRAANGLSSHELALRKVSSYSAVRLKYELNNVFDLTNASRLIEFTKIINKFQLTKELKALAKELRIKPPYLISKPTHLKDVLLSNNWRYYPVHHEIPSNSQLFGRMLRDADFDAVLFPSTKYKGKNNIAVFAENLSNSDSYIELMDDAPEDTITKLDSNTWINLY